MSPRHYIRVVKEIVTRTRDGGSLPADSNPSVTVPKTDTLSSSLTIRFTPFSPTVSVTGTRSLRLSRYNGCFQDSSISEETMENFNFN